jgi:hypothetical protein
VVAGCSDASIVAPPPPPSTERVPLTDLSSGNYLGFAGGLYRGGNQMPAAHHAAGVAAARLVQPVNAAGSPAPNGKYVLLSIGMSNTTQEFCSAGQDGRCDPGTFVVQAGADPSVRTQGLVLVDGARGGETAATWDEPSDPNYDRVRDTRLAAAGVTERQVQVAWVKVANPRPTASLPNADADAYLLVRQIGGIARALRSRYPNLRLAFLSNRTYAGYATTTLNPEPYAYESGFAVKWVVDAQIVQMSGGGADARAGNLDYRGAAPWIGWGPDLWAAGTRARSDGLVWLPEDFQPDGTHPSPTGVAKVGRLLLEFLKSSPQTGCWFVVGGTCQ